MERRAFLKSTALAGLAATTGVTAMAQENRTAGNGYQLKYAPHIGMFRALAGEDPIDQLKYMADQGFTALEDNGMMKRPVEQQEKMAREMERLGITMGVFVASASFEEKTFVRRESRGMLVQRIRDAVEVARRVNAKWMTVVPDAYDIDVEWDYQTANVIENLKACAEICEPHGLIMVLEPLNHWTDHPGLFLTKIPQAYMICKAVNSPSCKILNDLYHQQITEGNLIPNLLKAWDEIAYFQVGDNPGRNEPGTGEINYQNIFKLLYERGYDGIIGMEHGVQATRDINRRMKDGEQVALEEQRAAELTLIDAYRWADNF